MRPVFLFAKQRSGTNLLRGVLNSHPKIAALDEVFHQNADATIGWYRYLVKAVRDDPLRALPDRKTITGLFDGYLADLGARHAGAEVVLLDVKYNSAHALNTLWHGPLEQPEIIRYARARGIRTIHVVRRNILAAHLSQALAVANDMSTDRHGFGKIYRDAHTRRTLAVEPKTLAGELQARRIEIDLFTGWLGADGPAHLTLDFEDFIADGRFAEPVLAKLAGFLGVEPAFDPAPRTRKVSPGRPAAIIENLDAARTALAGTPFAAMLEG